MVQYSKKLLSEFSVSTIANWHVLLCYYLIDTDTSCSQRSSSTVYLLWICICIDCVVLQFWGGTKLLKSHHTEEFGYCRGQAKNQVQVTGKCLAIEQNARELTPVFVLQGWLIMRSFLRPWSSSLLAMKPAAAHWDSYPTAWQPILRPRRSCKQKLTKPSQIRSIESTDFLCFILLSLATVSVPLTNQAVVDPSRPSQPMRAWCRWSTWTWWWMRQWGCTPLLIVWSECQRLMWKSAAWPSPRTPSSWCQFTLSTVTLICGLSLTPSNLRGTPLDLRCGPRFDSNLDSG